ncbi:MAG TPA: hypothetical protein VF834_01175 [Streptosporangiaceae bacterium]
MGVFKSMRDLQKQAQEIERNSPPVGDRLRAAQERMSNMNQMLAAQTQAANAAAAAAAGLASGTAVRRTVTITGMQQVGMINFDLLVQFDLTVLPDGMPPYPATTQQTVSQMQIGQIRPGMTLEASVDQANPSAIWLDLSSIR